MNYELFKNKYSGTFEKWKPGGFVEIVEPHPDGLLFIGTDNVVYKYYDHSLYEFFDSLYIYGSVDTDPTGKRWWYKINGVNFFDYFEGRKEAEDALYLKMAHIHESSMLEKIL